MATLEERLEELLLELGTDYKNTVGKVGNLNALAVAATNLVDAINQVKAIADAAVEGTAPDASTSVKGIVEIATDSEALALAAQDVVVTPGNLGALRGANNGLAGLDGSGKVPSAQLPAFVDDVVEYANLAAFPGSGESGKIYVALDTNKTYRWGGSSYAEISPSPGSTDAVTEGSVNLYYTTARAQSAADSRITAQLGNPDRDLLAVYTAAKA